MRPTLTRQQAVVANSACCACVAQFDRHDWEVERGMGKGTTRYVIDYYYDNSKSEQDDVPELGMQASANGR